MKSGLLNGACRQGGLHGATDAQPVHISTVPVKEQGNVFAGQTVGFSRTDTFEWDLPDMARQHKLFADK